MNGWIVPDGWSIGHQPKVMQSRGGGEKKVRSKRPGQMIQNCEKTRYTKKFMALPE